jgi:hypothetical protein
MSSGVLPRGSFRGRRFESPAPKTLRGPFALQTINAKNRSSHGGQDERTKPPLPAIRLAISVARDNTASNTTMRLSTIGAGVIACLATNVAATALTYKLDANEQACFYAETKKDNEKISFYFAVRLHHARCPICTFLPGSNEVCDRSNPVVHSMSTTLLRAPMPS